MIRSKLLGQLKQGPFKGELLLQIPSIEGYNRNEGKQGMKKLFPRDRRTEHTSKFHGFDSVSFSSFDASLP